MTEQFLSDEASVQNRRVAIIGGAGFIGHHLSLELAERGAIVYVIDSLQVNNILAVSTAEPHDNWHLYLKIVQQRLDSLRDAGLALIVQDARDYHALGRVLASIAPDVIVHAAAVAHAGRSNKDPYTTFDHSLRTLENALDYARDNVEHFVFLSSSMVYGDFASDVVDEKHALEPLGIYGALKLAGEKIVIAYQQVFDLPYTIVRPSALYGPRCISRRVVQVFVERALAGSPLEIEGDGSDRLDFTYIEDLVSGLCLVIGNPGARNEVFNLTYGQALSIADLAAVLQDEFPNVEIEFGERDRLMPRRGTLSVAKAREVLGYEPQNPIAIGVPKYVAWYRQLMHSAASA